MLMEVLRSRRCSQISRIRQATNSQKVGSIPEVRMLARQFLDLIKVKQRLSATSKLLKKTKQVAIFTHVGTRLILEMISSFSLKDR